MLEGESIVEDIDVGDGRLTLSEDWASNDSGSASNGGNGERVLHDDCK